MTAPTTPERNFTAGVSPPYSTSYPASVMALRAAASSALANVACLWARSTVMCVAPISARAFSTAFWQCWHIMPFTLSVIMFISSLEVMLLLFPTCAASFPPFFFEEWGLRYLCVLFGSKRRSLSALVTTDTLLRLIAAAAIMGLSSGPPKACSTPAATGMPNVL